MTRSEIFKKFKPEMNNILGLLHELQNNNPKNYLSKEDLADVAKYLNTTYSHVFGVATYYSMYSVKPRGKYIIRICNSPVCNMEGGDNIETTLKDVLGVNVGETTSDGIFTLEHTECLGRCEIAPCMMIHEVVYGHLDKNKVEKIVQNYK